MTQPHILIIGAGPAGLGAAYQLTKKKLASVTVVEKERAVGGIAGSFNISGINVDYGSHRLHPACESEILDDIRSLLGNDLLTRPRHGRIRLRNRWIRFPLKPLDLALRLPFSFSMSAAADVISRTVGFRSNSRDNVSFANVLQAGLGKTVCREFYFPYVQKIWGLPPQEISPVQAQRRVSANSIHKMIMKVLSSFPGFKQPSAGIFYYPKEGFGRISSGLFEYAKKAGAEFYLDARVTSLRMNGSSVETVTSGLADGRLLADRADYVWSTIPISILVNLFEPPAPPSIIELSKKIKYRAMILIYLVVEQAQFSQYDAHYFPDSDIPVTRISEPKNYSLAEEPENLTVLCAELPCCIDDRNWKMTDAELGDMVCDSLRRASIPLKSPPKKVLTRRITHAYPVYSKGYEKAFDQIDRWLGRVQNLVSFGRQGLFAHDNTHHALYMAYAAVDCLSHEGRFDRNRWKQYRQVFNSHVVED
jgi:protoporphyrinogen oxidase